MLIENTQIERDTDNPLVKLGIWEACFMYFDHIHLIWRLHWNIGFNFGSEDMNNNKTWERI